ncbi:tRNA pseudouridine(13) synthase TruD [Catenovulum sp. SM1970]|uniref:tRNA pseudouridine(13) synthase TruD n=1 Tax=Marinifaba aquimaris TaxID=2741323 RepID=UPI0015727F0F|nr:tRNA pseudouridine(13) synthase TruD [Marinifaba aquimaris]NTS78059.1 tRNA pseudouridine(13) synthase TruD [Marinifaba aquimaris]
MSVNENLAYLHGKPELTAKIRSQNADFKVVEVMGFEPSGEGEHLWLWVEKDGQNTGFVSQQIAKALGIEAKVVATSGQKDRHAITQQWFAVPYPIKKPLPKHIDIPGAKVLKMARHGRKLKTGTHKANLFEIKLLHPSLDDAQKDALEQRLLKVQALGVPNYFGEQRFGHQGKNIDKARELFAGKFKVRDKKKRGMYISAARSLIFNEVINERINQDLIKPLDGDVFILAGSNSHFAQDEINEDILARYAFGDIQLSAPMWGEGELKSSGQVAQLEHNVVDKHQDLAKGLIDLRLRQERRNLILKPEPFKWRIENEQTIIKFALPTGCFATSILREIADYQDVSGLAKTST